MLADNLARLTTPELSRRIESTEVRNVEVRATADQQLSLRLAGRALCSAVSPLREAESWAATVDTSRATHLVLFGLGLGYHLEALRRRTALPLVVLEPSAEVIHVALSRRELKLPDVRIVGGLAELRDCLAAVLGAGDLVEVQGWPPSRRLFSAVFDGTQAAVRAAVELAQVSGATLDRRLRVWVRHLLENLPRCVGLTPARGLSDARRGYPAIVVAAGPSLDRNAEQLRRAAGRATVIAVNTAAGALEQAQVQADYIVALEVLDVSCQLEQLAHNVGTPRLLASWSHPALFQPEGVDLLPFPVANAYFEQVSVACGLGSGLGVGGSVSSAAFGLARMMGADPIILVGQDLAYSGDRVYARGTAFDQIRMERDGESARLTNLEAKRRIGASLPEADTTRERWALERAPGWGGGEVATTIEFNYFRYAFEALARQIQGTELINATEGGAHIEGYAERPLAEVLDALPRRAPPPQPPTAKLTAPAIGDALTAELEGCRRARREARQALHQGADGPLGALSAAVKGSGLLGAYSWTSLQRLMQDQGSSPSDLCRRVADDAEQTAALVEAALQKISK